jgi:hypothetical protein
MLLKLTDTAKIKAGNLELVDPISRGLVQDKPYLLWLTLKLQRYHKGPGFSMPNFRAFQDCHRLLVLILVRLIIIEKGIGFNPVFIYSEISQTLETKLCSFHL